MNPNELIRAGKYAEAVVLFERALEKNPNDKPAVQGMAKVLRAVGDYERALRFYILSAELHHQETAGFPALQGSAAWQIQIACLRWILGDRIEAIRSMHALVAGILDGSIKYGDAAGAVTQGLLLYYMSATLGNSDEARYALRYLQNKIKNSKAKIWPIPIAQFYLNEVDFEYVVLHVNENPKLFGLTSDLLNKNKRKRLAVALFHDAVKNRAEGREDYAFSRMKECAALEDTMMVEEWYLAREEVARVRDADTAALVARGGLLGFS